MNALSAMPHSMCVYVAGKIYILNWIDFRPETGLLVIDHIVGNQPDLTMNNVVEWSVAFFSNICFFLAWLSFLVCFLSFLPPLPWPLMSVFVSVSVSLCLPFCLALFICLCVSLSVCVSVCLSLPPPCNKVLFLLCLCLSLPLCLSPSPSPTPPLDFLI